MTCLEVSLVFYKDTGLVEIKSSGGNLSLTQMEMAMVYTMLKKSLGFRGRFKLWRMRKRLFSSVNSN